MDKQIIEDASLENLKCFANYVLDKCENEEFEIFLYTLVNGDSFNKELSELATSELVNEDGSSGAHITLVEASELANRFNVDYVGFNEYDWFYTLNMIYSDYYGAVPDDITYYVNLAKKFLLDKDAKEGKAFRYWLNNK